VRGGGGLGDGEAGNTRRAGPGFSIGIVVPHLAEVREQLEGLLDDALHPQTLRPDLAELPRSYNFSWAGRWRQPLVPARSTCWRWLACAARSNRRAFADCC
jgi:hypothetical protein